MGRICSPFFNTYLLGLKNDGTSILLIFDLKRLLKIESSSETDEEKLDGALLS